MGHSWVLDLEEGFDPAPMPEMEVVFLGYPGVTLTGLKDKMVQILDTTYTHMVVCIVITEAYRREPVSDLAEDQRFWVTVPNEEYDNDQFCRSFTEFSRHCTDICPNLKILLIIPPFLDLVYFKFRRLERYPQRIKEIYNRRPEFSPRTLNRQCVDHHSYVRTLRTDRYQWINKNSYPVMYVASALVGKQKIRDFFTGRRLTLRMGGFLRDGLHPCAQLCTNLWRKLYQARLFHPVVEVRRVISSEVRTAPYMALELPEGEQRGIVERSGEVLEEVRDEVESQGGP